MKIDLTNAHDSTQEIEADALEAISDIVRPAYVDLMSRLSVAHKGDIDWWVSSFAVRNTYVCPLYNRLCQLILVKHFSEKEPFLDVIVDSNALAETIRSMSGESVKISTKNSRGKVSYFVRFFCRYFGVLYHLLSQWFFSSWLLKKKVLPDDSSVLLDMFFTEDTVCNNTINDRYYPGLMECLEQSERSHIYYTPTHYRVRNYFSYYKKLIGVGDHLILKEDVLGLYDYIYALMHPIRFDWPKNNIDFMGINIGALVRESIVETFSNSSSILGVLQYRFVKKLKSVGFKPGVVIEWFENQEVDHGAIAGWREYFPDIEVVGYQGFLASKHYLSMFPTKQEHEFSLLPTKVAVIGSCMLEPVKEFCAELDVVMAPAFRFTSVWNDEQSYPREGLFTVLVTLPIHLENSRDIVKVIEEIVSTLDGQSHWRFLIKPHPAWSENEISKLLITKQNLVKIVKGSFDKLLDESNVVIGAASSASVHAISRGVPSIIIGQPVRLLQNPIPDLVNNSLWSVCYSAKSLIKSLEFYSTRSSSEVISASIEAEKYREVQFNPVTKDSVHDFIWGRL